GVGNACNVDGDGDEWSDLLDNCPAVSNPSQADGDGDHRGDACDCAPSDGGSFAPVGEVTGELLGPAPSHSLTWPSQAAAAGAGTKYDVVSISLAQLWAQASFSAATCLVDDH